MESVGNLLGDQGGVSAGAVFDDRIKKRIRAIAKTSSIAQVFLPRKRVKLERERCKKEWLRV